MKNKIIFFLCLLLPGSAIADNFAKDASYSICFTPHGNCTSQIVNTISQAKRQILVQAYSFTSAPIAKALVDARNRGIDVKIILDKGQVTAKYSVTTFFNNHGINPSIDYKPAIAHNKIMIIDDAVITGSFNFTKAAQEKNAENVLIIHDAGLAKKYIANWQNRMTESMSVSQYIKFKR